MAATLVDFKGYKVVTPDPVVGVGGQGLNDNFKKLASRLFVSVPFLAVLSRSSGVPAPAPAIGDAYIVGPTPSGAWAGHSGVIAQWYAGAWEFTTPGEGWHARVADTGELVRFEGGAWAPYVFGNPLATTRYQFRLTYSGTNPTGVDPAEPLPVGWSAVFSGATVTITHTAGKSPAWVSYLGRNGALNVLRYPTAVAQLSINVGEEAVKFSISAGTATTGAASGSSALVVVQF